MAQMLEIGNGSRLFKNFLKFFLVHLIIFAKSWQNFTFFGTFFKKFPKSDQFPWNFSKFSRLHALCGKKFWKFDLDLLKMPNFSKNLAKNCLLFRKNHRKPSYNSVIFPSNFLSDIVIVALTWLKKGPKKEN